MSITLVQFREALSLRLVDAQALGASRELSLAVTALQTGRMRLGTVALLLGSPNPYPQADNPASAEIRPTADTLEPGDLQLPEDPVAAVKTVRKRLQPLIDDLVKFRRVQWPRHYGTLEESLFDQAIGDIMMGKAWLGEQLAVLAGHPVVKPRNSAVVVAAAQQSLEDLKEEKEVARNVAQLRAKEKAILGGQPVSRHHAIASVEIETRTPPTAANTPGDDAIKS